MTPEECQAYADALVLERRKRSAALRSARSKRWHDSNPEYLRSYHAANRAKHNRQTKENHLTRKYGITIQERDDLFAAQGHRCKICAGSKPGGRGDWAVDHCHETGIVRGILCYNCNLLLGFARDNQNILGAAIHYLGGNHA